MEKLLANRELSIEENQSNLKSLREAFRKNETSSDVKMERIHIESTNPNGRVMKGNLFININTHFRIINS
jgi:hypothetical protein